MVAAASAAPPNAWPGFRFIGIPIPSYPLPLRLQLLGLAAGLVAALTITAAGYAVRRAWTHPARPIVAVAVFENESGDPANGRVVAGLSDAIVERLTALGPARIGVNGNASILRRPRDARDTRAVAKETGAAYLVSGQLQTKAGQLSLLVQLIRLDDGTHVWVHRIGHPAGDALETLDAEVAHEVERAVRGVVLKESILTRARN